MRATRGVPYLAVMTALAACGPSSSTPIDMTPPIDFDNGTCGAELRFTGELIDWDQDVNFCGVFDAQFHARGNNAMDSTAPNGRFDMCVPNQATAVVDITPPTAASPCSNMPGTYTMPAIAVVSKAVVESGVQWSGRVFAIGRETFDPAKAQLFVHVDGKQRAVSVGAAHGAPQAITDKTWAAGDTGHEVFFRDVEVGSGSTTVSVAGGALGTGEVPLAAGTITLVTVNAQ